MMNPSEYLVFVLYYVESKSLSEIADVMNMPEPSVRAIHDRVLMLAGAARLQEHGLAAPAGDTMASGETGAHWHRAA